MANQKKTQQGGRSDQERSDAPREAGAEERIEQRRDRDREISKREDEGWSQPESSAQKTPNPGPPAE